MKLEDMIMVVENQKGKDTNFLLNLTDYMELALKLWGEYAEDMAEAVGSLYGTKGEKKEWSELYFAADQSIRVSFCSSERQLEAFLAGDLNGGEWSFDTERCSKECLDVLRIYNLQTDGKPLFPYLHYEPVEHTFHAGEVLHNLNGNDYRVLAALSPKNLLLVSLKDSQFLVGRGVRLYERYPAGERPDSSMVEGIVWEHGVYLGHDLTGTDFDILKQEYGEPERIESVPDLREKIRKSFWMQKNVEQKEGLPERLRNVAKNCMEHIFGTSEPDVFAAMLGRGVYDGMYQKKEEPKKIPGGSR